MNCPSRTDETQSHPGWKQNPPFLAGDLTTRQDLNGAVNSRILRPGPGPSETGHSERFEDPEGLLDSPPGKKVNIDKHAEYCLFYKNEINSATSADSSIGAVRSWLNGTRQHIDKVLCILLCTSPLTGLGLLWSMASNGNEQHSTPLPATSVAKRASSCGNGRNASANYDTPLHVGALLIILFVSTTACAFPMLGVRFPRLHIPSGFLFVVRHFGTGVLIATAFCHLLPTAFINLGDPCLSDFWTNDYPAMPGAIALAAIFLVAVVEMVLSPAQHICGAMGREIYNPTPAHHSEREHSSAAVINRSVDGDSQTDPGTSVNNGNSVMRRERPLVGRSSSMGRGLAHMNVDLAAWDEIKETQMDSPFRAQPEKHSFETNADYHYPLTPKQKHKKDVMQCMLLEMGILFHSVFIGMALSVSVGSDFVILLIAITFHQTFEGLALGSRIASLTWEKGVLQPWLMALAYGCTTPVGQAIGLGTHTLYDPQSEVGLIMVGVMNAISSGLLVYASLVELLSEDFLSDESWRLLRGRRRVLACILVFLGAFGMSLIGAWA